jgi:hypothetical protein
MTDKLTSLQSSLKAAEANADSEAIAQIKTAINHEAWLITRKRLIKEAFAKCNKKRRS